ncbi:MAG TPA: CBS domain-containing protein, partial [Anaerolineales bacterium]|nr:CBS domain-containing protein [Anaerolineales bacterium]
MRIILTHEQADFDALASLLAAHLTDPDSTPVLPWRMNRNVRAFLTLYGHELPFIEQRELNGEPISAVTLVDTQSMATVRGVVSNPVVRVIDHHPRRDSLSPNWETWISEIGATTTVLTETLQEQNVLLTPIQATLMMLGIYEDTGSLTYAHTSPRDILAAGFLLAQGANLSVLNDFLNHPLSKEQQVIYDELREAVENLQIHGYTILLALGDAHGTDEELSSIAHKLRDLYDPAAIFLLVQTRSGVQMIARSNTDHIDVGEISEAFGGGGHDRAAAALIHDRDLQDIRTELIEMLPVYIRPAVTVSQIMSRIPQVLTPDTSDQEAARRMSLYGYEGYPVVENGQVVGLLTRRQVDRAIAHKLNYTARQLMSAGQITVSADDSIEQLQEKMINSGWGQIPVVDPHSQAIIGIVTRTDLLKTLPGHSRPPT